MAYADPTKQRDYQREYKRLRRSGDCQTPSQTQLSAAFRLRTAQDVLEPLGEQTESRCGPIRRLRPPNAHAPLGYLGWHRAEGGGDGGHGRADRRD